MRSTNNIAIVARIGRWSARHRAKAIVGWLVFVLVAAMIGGSAEAADHRRDPRR